MIDPLKLDNHLFLQLALRLIHNYRKYIRFLLKDLPLSNLRQLHWLSINNIKKLDSTNKTQKAKNKPKFIISTKG
ncbi:hypothetical protein DDN30_12180 [Vibrio cholerae]|nr:hypothetical protein [Vibrio cholerae]EGR4447007.1 hypothetical protein [Vibrio cholerae]